MTAFKVSAMKGKEPIIIDHKSYKVTIYMSNGIVIKFFKEHNDRWYKIREVNYNYFKLDECIKWAKSHIDLNSSNLISRLENQIQIKSQKHLNN